MQKLKTWSKTSVYPGSRVSNNGNCDKECSTRIGKASRVFGRADEYLEEQAILEVHGRARREAARRRKSECKVNLGNRNSSRTNGNHRRRLHGGDGAIAPTAKKLWGRCLPSRPHRNFVMSPLNTAKRYSKNYECVIMKLKKRCQPGNAPKAFSGRPDPLGELTVLLQTHYLDLKGRRYGQGKGKERERRGGRGEEGVTGEKQVGREGR